ncbi:MAG TPA: IPT/TIG domain-containing protein, partial [Thermoanaerobaculia bacterium]|nr:IPT/TIG domain-containing protein [Thermoanaerobaculia bacterium]
MRSPALFLVLSLFLSTAAVAQQGTVRFDPPDPTSRTQVIAHIHLPSATCAIGSASVTRVGQFIGIVLESSTLCNPINVAPSGADFDVELGVVPPGVYHVSITPPTILLSLAEATLIVRDANPPFEVQPNALPAPEEPVHLVGHSLVSCLSGIACEHIDVRIGDTLAEVISANPTEIVVRVPPTLPPGTYDVTIARTTSVLRATAALHIGPPDEGFYERVLLPVFFSGPGAFGSDWRTSATLYNGASFPWSVPQPTIFTTACFPECDVRPQSRASVIASGPSFPAGVVEWAPRQSAAVSDFGLRVIDVSRSAQDLGTEVPVVREDDLYDRTFQLLEVPSDSRYRATLRLYDLDGPRTFLVRVYAMGALTPPLVERQVRLNAETSLHGGGFAVVNDLIAG